MVVKNKLLTILSGAEQEALYGLPDFDDGQQLEYLSLSEAELSLATSRPGIDALAYCILLISYFKAKHAFLRFAWTPDVESDVAFVLSRYFHSEVFEPEAITYHAHYTQRHQIAKLFGFRPWSKEFLHQLMQQAAQVTQRDVT
jgi:hypothetical protein